MGGGSQPRTGAGGGRSLRLRCREGDRRGSGQRGRLVAHPRPSAMATLLPPLRDWQAFEDLCCDLWRELWRDPEAQKHGRSGQRQEGVDGAEHRRAHRSTARRFIAVFPPIGYSVTNQQSPITLPPILLSNSLVRCCQAVTSLVASEAPCVSPRQETRQA